MTVKNLTPRTKQAIFIWMIIALSYLIVWTIPAYVDFAGKGEGAEQAAAILRQSGQFKWYVITLFLVVVNFYIDEARRKNWSGILAGLAFFLMDFFNEIWNGLFYTASGGFSAVWMCAYPTAYEPLMGWNIEIVFMFLIMGIASTKILPEDKEAMVFGKINNRHFIAFIMAWLCVIVEIILNLIGALVWNYWWWKPPFPWLVFLIGYLPFWEIAFYVYDLPSLKAQVKVVGGMAIVLITAFGVFTSIGWI